MLGIVLQARDIVVNSKDKNPCHCVVSSYIIVVGRNSNKQIGQSNVFKRHDFLNEFFAYSTIK